MSEFAVEVDSVDQPLSLDAVKELMAELKKLPKNDAESLLQSCAKEFGLMPYGMPLGTDARVNVTVAPAATDGETSFTLKVAEVTLKHKWRISAGRLQFKHRELFMTITLANTDIDDMGGIDAVKVFFICLIAAALFIIAVCAVLVTGPITFAMLAPIIVEFAYICAGLAGEAAAIGAIKDGKNNSTENKEVWKNA